MMSSEQSTFAGTKAHRAGAFDIRNVIAILMGIYGVVLVVCSFVLDPGMNPDESMQKSAGDNLWTGIAMLVVALIFGLWARLRPIVVPDHEVESGGHE